MFKLDSHPKTIDIIRTYLAKNSLVMLIFHFLLLLVTTSIILSNILFILNKDYTFFTFFKFSFLQLLGRDNYNDIIHDTSTYQMILYFLLSVFSLVLPALFFGAIIFKLFIKKGMITFRKITSVYWSSKNNENILGIRLYNSSKLLLVDLTFKVFLRILHTPPDGSPHLQNVLLHTNNPNWPIAITHVPYTVAIPLNDEDLFQGNECSPMSLISIQKNKLGDENRILIIVKGCIPDLGSDFVETYWYKIPENIKFGSYFEIDVNYNAKSKKWNGWENFDRNK